MWITTSWDDGHPLDLRLAALLDRYGMRGTFYIARDYLSLRLSEAEIAALAQRHEIGAHTFTHSTLTTLPVLRARREITGSRDWLQAVTGTPITAFCPPYGMVDQSVRNLIAAAEFEVARTTQLYQLAAGNDPLLLPTTIHVAPFPLHPSGTLIQRLQPLRNLRRYFFGLRLPVRSLRNWSALAIALLDRAAAVGGVWHLWGHSWEIEQYHLWGELERVLAEARYRYPWAQRVTNTELVRGLWSIP